MPQIDFADMTPDQLRRVDPETLDADELRELIAAQRSVRAAPSAGDLYGGGPGGGTPSLPQRSEGSRAERIAQFEVAYNNRSARPNLTKFDYDRYMQDKLGSHVARSWQLQGLKRWQTIDPAEIDA